MSSCFTSRDNKLSKPKRRHKRTDVIRNTTKKQQRIIEDAARERRTEDGRRRTKETKREKGNIGAHIQRRLDIMTTDFRKPEQRRRPLRHENDPTMGSEDADVTRRFKVQDMESGRHKNENRERRRAKVKEDDREMSKTERRRAY